MDNLKKRILTGLLLVAIITAAVSFTWVGFGLLILAINLLALSEFYRLFYSATLSPRKYAGIILSTSMLITYTLLITGTYNWKILLINVPVAISVFIFELYSKSRHPFQNIAITFLGIICITIPLCFFVGISFFPLGQWAYHPQTAFGYFVILWASDTGAYFTGKYLGRHPLFKRISPKKTWEGSLGGAACAIFVSYIISNYFTILKPADWILIALIIVVTGTFGDLIKSLMKRSLDLKDSGTILPGHGGILDRFDTLLGSAPFVFCYLSLFRYTINAFIIL